MVLQNISWCSSRRHPASSEVWGSSGSSGRRIAASHQDTLIISKHFLLTDKNRKRPLALLVVIVASLVLMLVLAVPLVVLLAVVEEMEVVGIAVEEEKVRS